MVNSSLILIEKWYNVNVSLNTKEGGMNDGKSNKGYDYCRCFKNG